MKKRIISLLLAAAMTFSLIIDMTTIKNYVNMIISQLMDILQFRIFLVLEMN